MQNTLRQTLKFIMKAVFIIIFVSFDFVSPKTMNDMLTTENMQTYFGVSSIREVPEYEIVNPVSNIRHKRSIDGTEFPEQHEVKIRAFGEDYHMELWKNKALVRPGSIVQYMNENKITSTKPIVNNCYYFGKLTSHNSSRAAISTCKGISGMFRHGDTDVYIQPLKDEHANRVRSRRSDLDDPHVIFRRSAGDIPNMETDETRDMKKHACGNDKEYYPDADKFNKMTERLHETEDRNSSRNKRQAIDTDERHLELLVVADYQMHLYHGSNVEDYTLTLMNIAAGLYADYTLGTYFHLYITRLIVMQTPSITESGSNFLQVTDNAGDSLNQFCNFQRQLLYNSVGWDNAVLISRYNLHLSGNKNLLGLASLASTCRAESQCSINEDTGLASGLIIAHELGHNLGINHDGGNCQDGLNIMSSTSTGGSGTFSWSTCSKSQLKGLLNVGWFECTREPPSNVPSLITDDLPGSEIDANRQCELSFSAGYMECTNTLYNNDCGRLWCQIPGSFCQTRGSPKMDGTFCGANQVCMQGTCTYFEGAPVPVDGGWSAYDTSYGSCSRTCGGGVQFKFRYCNNPEPANGGSDCIGDNKLPRLCNIESCLTTQEDFRDEQCASTNTIPLNGNYLLWSSSTFGRQGNELCRFFCVSDNNISTNRGQYFRNGTRCDVAQPDSHNICVMGTCTMFGCDGQPGSSAVYDKCGVCGGFGNTCSYHSGTIARDSTTISAYVKVLTIPSRATSVTITNRNSYSRIAVKINNQYVIGGPSPSAPSAMEYKYNTLSLYYTRDPETLVIPKETETNIEIEAYQYGGQPAAQIQWEMYLPPGVNPNPVLPSYQWIVTDEFGHCSASCGQGTMSKIIACFRNDGVRVEDSNCNGETRPQTSTSTCNLGSCSVAYEWVTTNEYTECSVSCGPGTQNRKIVCRRTNDGVDVADSFCSNQPRPTSTPVYCNLGSCSVTYEWVTTNEYTECTVSCGPGTQNRKIVCRRTNDGVDVPDSFCSNQPRPTSTPVYCNLGSCPVTYEWVTTNEYTECSVSCGPGTKNRKIVCRRINDGVDVADSFCNDQTRPTSTPIYCNLVECMPNSQYQWFERDEFGECSTECGPGTRSKMVNCLHEDLGVVDDSYCNEEERLTPATESCNLGDCIAYRYVFGSFGPCSVTCGVGVKTRFVVCATKNNLGHYTITDESNCNENERPSSTETCTNSPCESSQGVWVIGDWSDCSESCGGGIRSRTVTCKQGIDSIYYLVESECPPDKPETEEVCNTAACPTQPPINPTQACNVLLTDQNSRIRVGNTNGEFCNTTIVAPVNQRIILKFISVDVDCNNGGNFIVKDGSRSYSVCSALNNIVWPISTSSVMEIAGITKQNTQGYEISFSFQTVSYDNDGCDSIQTSETGSVSSPNYPSTYSANTDCNNYIVAPPGKRISLTFTLFDIEYHYYCGYDSVRIKDLGQGFTYYCGRGELALVSKTNKVLVMFHSDPLIERPGFYATYSFV